MSAAGWPGMLLAISTVPLAVASLVLEGRDAIVAGLQAADPATWAAVLWQSVGNTMFGYGAWSWLLARHPPATVTPAALLVRLPRLGPSALPDRAWWGLLAGYAVAKGFELADHAVLDALGGRVSGHTLKHLVAAAAAAWILRAVLNARQLR